MKNRERMLMAMYLATHNPQAYEVIINILNDAAVIGTQACIDWYGAKVYIESDILLIAGYQSLPQDIKNYIDTLKGTRSSLNARILTQEEWEKVQQYEKMRGE